MTEESKGKGAPPGPNARAILKGPAYKDIAAKPRRVARPSSRGTHGRRSKTSPFARTQSVSVGTISARMSAGVFFLPQRRGERLMHVFVRVVFERSGPASVSGGMITARMNAGARFSKAQAEALFIIAMV